MNASWNFSGSVQEAGRGTTRYSGWEVTFGVGGAVRVEQDRRAGDIFGRLACLNEQEPDGSTWHGFQLATPRERNGDDHSQPHCSLTVLSLARRTQPLQAPGPAAAPTGRATAATLGHRHRRRGRGPRGDLRPQSAASSSSSTSRPAGSCRWRSNLAPTRPDSTGIGPRWTRFQIGERQQFLLDARPASRSRSRLLTRWPLARRSRCAVAPLAPARRPPPHRSPLRRMGGRLVRRARRLGLRGLGAGGVRPRVSALRPQRPRRRHRAHHARARRRVSCDDWDDAGHRAGARAAFPSSSAGIRCAG